MIEGLTQEYFKAVSRFVTTMRQHNEWGNGGEYYDASAVPAYRTPFNLSSPIAGLEKAFPAVWAEAHSVADAERVREDIITTIHLYNLRTRRVGYNQLLTVYRRHASVAWEEQLRAKTLAEYMAIAHSRFYDDEYLTGGI
jgi:hypothetical protein